MPNMSNQELVRAFNINLRFNGIAVTNCTVQNLYGEDHIVISFDKNMDSKQCMKYLSNLKEKIVKASYKTKEVAGMPYNLQSFPFTFHKERLDKDDKGRKRFSVVIDEGVVFNLKCYLAKALARDIKEKMGSEFGVKYARERVYDVDFDRNSYLYSMYFDDQRLQKYFIDSFSADIKDYENAPSGYLEVRGNYVHIKKSIFDDVEFIKDIAAYNASLECRYLQTPSTKNKAVDKLKHTVIDFMDRTADVPVRTIIRTSHNGSNENSVLIPLVNQIKKDSRLLDDNDAYKINSAFNMEILSDVSESISVRLPKSDSSDGIIYGIDFADVDIACCVLNKIIESSVINKDHELAIDPELHLQALSPAQSPFNSPTHAEPSGLRTPPNSRKRNRDSGIGESPPKPEDSVAHSSSGGPSPYFTELLSPTQEFPTRDQNVVLKDSPRRESEKFPVLLPPPLGTRGVPGTSKEFSPSLQLNSTAVSYGVSGPSSSLQSVGAAQNRWLPQGTSGNKWTSSLQFTQPEPIDLSWTQSGPSSSKGANESGSAWTSQPMNHWLSPAPSAEPSLWQPSRPLSRKGANESGSAWASQPIGFWSSPTPSAGLWSLPQSGPLSRKGASDKPLTEEEEKLSKALLYWFNLNNYALDPPHTNFIVKNGKIASLMDDSVDIKEYLQEVIDKTKEEYCVNKKEAYDLNEFPFKFLSNCEKNQETTVVANISRGALLNLKELFSQEHEGKVEIKDIDINIVKKAVKSKKDEWVNFQVREHGLSPKAAIETCCPDESALEYIPIIKDKGGYWLDRDYSAEEVKFFREKRWPAKDTSKDEKMKSEDNKDSSISSEEATDAENVSSEAAEDNKDNDYSSGFVTDAENVSSEADAITGSGYESMDCENTGGGSPKRKSEKPLEGSPEKSLRRDSSPLSRLESLSLSSSSHQIGKC